MRLHRIKLTHVKGVADREIVFPDSGVVVVEGENEAGKTTMIEALDLLFEEKDSSKKRHVLSMRPVGLDVASEIEAEVTSGPYRFTYRKQWFRKPSTVLTVHAPRREELTGTAAHERVREILDETTDADLWRALRLMQATPLGATDLSSSAALSQALDEAAGQVGSAGAEGDSLLEAAEAVYREFFTPTGRPTGEYREAGVRVETARAARQEAAAAVREVADDVARHTAAVGEVDRLASQLAANERVQAELQEQWEAAQRVVRERDLLATRTAVARQAYEAAVEAVRRREGLVGEAEAAQRALDEAEAALTECRGDLDPGERRLEEARAHAETARRLRRGARLADSRAESDIALVADLHDLVDLAGRLQRLDDALETRRVARENARAARFPGSLPRIEAAERAVEIARAEWRAGSPSWRLTPQADGVRVVVDDEEASLDATRQGVVGAPVRIDVPGVVRLEIEPAAGAAERAEVVARAEREVADLLAEAGVADVAAARAAADRARDAATRAEEAEAAVAAVLGGSSADALRDRGEQLYAHVVELVARRVESESERLDGDTASSDGTEAAGAAAGVGATAADAEESVPAGVATGGGTDAEADPAAEVLPRIRPGVDVLPGIDACTPPHRATADAPTDDGGAALLASLQEAGPGGVGEDVVEAIVRWILATCGDEDDERLDGDAAAQEPGPVLRRAASRARSRESEAEAAIAAADAEVEALRTAVESARLRAARAEVTVEAARGTLGESNRRLAEARDRETGAALAAQVTDTQAALGEARAQESAVAAEVDRHDPESLRVRLDGATSATASLRRSHGEARDDRLGIEARLRHAGEQGRAERLIAAESDLAHAERTLAGLRRRAEAARTLFDALTRHRTEVRTAYVEPFGKAVSRLGRVVYGPDFDVEIGPGLTIDARVLGETRIPYEALSSGAKEQMSILARLACASLVDPEQGAPVILDDAMGYSDPARLQRVCSAFSLVGGDAQIILLTCTPGRYAAIPDAHVIQV